MRQAVALPETVSTQDPSTSSTTIRDDDDHRTNLDAARSTDTPEEETDGARSDATDLEMLLAKLDDKSLYHIDGPDSGSEVSVNCLLYLQY